MLAWMGKILAAIFQWLSPIILWVMKAVVFVCALTTVVAIIGCAGQVLIDQLKTAFEAGKSQKALFSPHRFRSVFRSL